MAITINTLIAAGLEPTQARQFAEPLQQACQHFGIDNVPRQAAFVSQCAHESANFTRLEEGLYYSTADRIRQVWPTRVPTLTDAATLCRNPQALANRVYANRNGNGDESSGDGWRYRGRGLIQLTGRANYLAAEAAINEPYKSEPDLLLLPTHAAMTAAWFFLAAGCNSMADAGNVAAITRAINGAAMLGLADRTERYAEALRAFA